MKIRSHALLIAVASMLGTAAHAQSSGNTSLGAYRSIVNPSVVFDDSFNRTTDIDTKISTDNSRSAVDSFNRTSDNDTTVDASRRTVDSFNTSLDYQTVTPTVNSVKSISTLDAQSASNVARMSGATQVGQQGDFNLSMGGGQPAYTQGGFYRSPAETAQTSDWTQANSVRLGGDNSGLIQNQNYMNLGGSQVVGSDLGNKQTFVAGPQTLGQGVTQDKDSATQTHASDVVSTTVSK